MLELPTFVDFISAVSLIISRRVSLCLKFRSKFQSLSLTDLTEAVFDDCDLQRAIFVNTNIEKTDFRTAFNYSIDLELNRIKKAKFSAHGISGLLDKYDIEIT
jgi:uncharacterized protein YjbI with pentapeptide repeats